MSILLVYKWRSKQPIAISEQIEWKRFKGTFRLNDWDAEKMYYILEAAEEY
ncbi:MAG: hypothetical protein AAF587_18520 [Bacteroidota bacterium]